MIARSRLRSIANAVTWHARGLVETDAVRRVKFGLRSLAQHAEIEQRREWARSIASPDALDPDAGFRVDPVRGLDTSRVCALADEVLSSTAPDQTHGKAFHRNHLLPAERAHVLLAVAMNEELIRIVATYLGIVPVLADLDFFCSLPTPASTPYSSSQLYHCDDECQSQLKLFVYCDAVSTLDGPLEVVEASRSQRVRDRIRYRYGGRAYRVGDDAMDALVPPREQHAIVGPRGTSVLLDTSRCFHRGSRIRDTARKRMVAVIQLVPPTATHLPLRLRTGAPYLHLVRADMPPLARAVLGEPVA